MTRSSKLVFFGNERLVSGLKHTNAPVLRGLIEAGYDIVAVVSHHTESRSRSARELEVGKLAKEYGIPLLTPDKPSEIINELTALQADAAVLVAYGKIIPQRVINVFGPVGIINLHPSLLPRWRGPTPIETTILSGDREAGVSLMQLTASMDEGPVYAQAKVLLDGNETKQSLYEKLSGLGTKLLLEVLPNILSNKLLPINQQVFGVTYTSLLHKTDGILTPLTDTAYVCERKIRAYSQYPKTKYTIDHNDVIITSAKIAQMHDQSKLIVECADNTLLEIVELIAPSGKRMSGQAYLQGYVKA